MMGPQGKTAEQQRKAEKRAAALRENLRRRKAAGMEMNAEMATDGEAGRVIESNTKEESEGNE